jgi:hypothetical protein
MPAKKLKTKKRKVSVVDKILKQLTPERVKKEVEAIKAIELPPELQKWVDEYNKVGDRDPFLWKWAYKISQTITLPFVSQKNLFTIWNAKFALIMFVTLVDDLIDKNNDKEGLDFVEKAININDNSRIDLNRKLPLKDVRYFDLIFIVWERLRGMLNGSPYYNVLEELIKYDVAQIVNGLRYASLIKSFKGLYNRGESIIYLSNNTPAILSYMIDLCFVNNLKISLGSIREVGWYAQCMTRIVNDLATWKRELEEQDCTSGIVSEGLAIASIGGDNLAADRKKILKAVAAKDVESHFIDMLDDYYRLAIIACKSNGLAVNIFRRMLDSVLTLHLISKKFI